MKKNLFKKNSMKRGFVKSFAVMMMVGLLSVSAFADESVNVYVTISDDKGALALAQEKITVTDIDGDNELTINDALYCTHEVKYKGGASAGYAAGQSQFGISLNKLWGIANGGSYGYFLNNKSPLSLSDKIKENDYINAFVYTDLVGWSDTYSFFDINSKEIKVSETIELNLMAAGYDASFNPVTLPVQGATITLNGEKTDFKTDSEGKVIITFDKEGSYVVSAISDTQNLVPPACKVEILVDENKGTNESATTVENTTTESSSVKENFTTKNESVSPETKDNLGSYAMVILLIGSMTLITVLSLRKKSF
ncbi:MAG: hypothetical protein IJA34_15515 [Lachnospiraceae bacterium]|nr:hypothetical protein [Lachnospiraceae bacterium]